MSHVDHKNGAGIPLPLRGKRMFAKPSVASKQPSAAQVVMNNQTLVIPSAKTVSRILFAAVLILMALSLFGQVSKYIFGHPMLKGFVPMFYVDYEQTAPTWYSSAALGLAGAILAVIACIKQRLGDRFRWHWTLLAILFFGLSLDEIAMIHELPIDPMREALDWGGPLYYGWVVPGIAFVALVGAAYLRFLWNLPKRTGRLFMLAGIVFVTGAIGVEMVSGMQADRFGEENLRYALIVTLEEFCEMMGVVIFIYALLEYIEKQFSSLEIRFHHPTNIAASAN